MGDRFYDLAVLLGRHPFWVNSSPVVSGEDHTDRPGGYILAANHESPYDIPLLMRHARRRLDFVSIVEVFENPLVARLYGAMNAFPLDRSRPDAGATKTIIDRLRAGRVIAMFPEGRLQPGEGSVLRGGRIKPGLGRIAELAGVPIVPCVIEGSGQYSRFSSWLPLRRTVYRVTFGPAIFPAADPTETERDYVEQLRQLARQTQRNNKSAIQAHNPR